VQIVTFYYNQSYQDCLSACGEKGFVEKVSGDNDVGEFFKIGTDW